MRTFLALAVILVAGCGGQQREETPRTLPVEKVQVRIQLLDPVEGLEAALAGWAASQAVEIVTVVGDDGVTPSLREIGLEDLDALRAEDALRPFPAHLRVDGSTFWGGDAGWRDGTLYAIPWRVDLVGLLQTGDEAPALTSWRDLDAALQERGPFVLDRDHRSLALIPLVWSAGGDWADSLGHVQVATDPAREALSFLERLVTEERCLDAGAVENALAAGEASMTVSGLALRARLGGTAHLTAFPPVEPDRGAAVAWLRARAWSIPSGGPDAKLAADLAWHLATNPACVALLAPGHLPASREAGVDAALADVAALLPSARLAPSVSAWRAVEEALDEAVAAIAARRRSPGAALDEAEQRVRATMRSR